MLNWLIIQNYSEQMICLDYFNEIKKIFLYEEIRSVELKIIKDSSKMISSGDISLLFCLDNNFFKTKYLNSWDNKYDSLNGWFNLIKNKQIEVSDDFYNSLKNIINSVKDIEIVCYNYILKNHELLENNNNNNDTILVKCKRIDKIKFNEDFLLGKGFMSKLRQNKLLLNLDEKDLIKDKVKI